MEDVAKKAGVSRKTVYNRFANKSALVGEVIATEGAEVCARAQAKLNISLPAAELIVQAELALLDAARRSAFVGMLIGPDAVSVSADAVDHSRTGRQGPACLLASDPRPRSATPGNYGSTI